MDAFEHHVIDSHTGEVVGKYKNLTRARGVRDKKDIEYGAVRYRVKSVPVDATASIKEQLEEKARQSVMEMAEGMAPRNEAPAPSGRMMPKLDLIKKRMYRLRSGE